MMSKVAIVLIISILAGCAVNRPLPPLGTPLTAVQAQLGQPTGVYPDGAGQVLEYATGPMGQTTWMAHFGADGRLIAIEQALDSPVFARLKIGEAGKDEVLRTIGRPAERSFLALPQLEVWSYRYKESGAWNSMMHLHFDKSGVLRMMYSGPDRMYEERRFFWP
jgi:hypothetical protein